MIELIQRKSKLETYTYSSPRLVLVEEPGNDGQKELLGGNVFHAYGPDLSDGIIQPIHGFRVGEQLEEEEEEDFGLES